ncbi:hypothetical protein PV11_09045 [Exophiala sideris]|uniref:Uncharacterized protein n=1 Tax=Exophiala sideris TaxID=1016849 RepID=A0A0D1VML4_9EURO|nr:hypothetical protein PV11_09045 [Exophiala sideris]
MAQALKEENVPEWARIPRIMGGPPGSRDDQTVNGDDFENDSDSAGDLVHDVVNEGKVGEDEVWDYI